MKESFRGELVPSVRFFESSTSDLRSSSYLEVITNLFLNGELVTDVKWILSRCPGITRELVDTACETPGFERRCDEALRN